MFRILLAEDDKNLREILSATLRKENYNVIAACDGEDAAQAFRREKFDLVITDVMMPHSDGNELCANIRRLSQEVPVLMLTALDGLDDKEKSFGAGADDYLSKPFALKELLMRVKALLRRSGSASEDKIELPHTRLDFSTLSLTINGKAVQTTKKEFMLLFRLLSRPDVIFSRERLMDEIWGYDSESADRTVDTHIRRIREKAQSDDFSIVTVRGLGYKAVIKK